MTSTTTSRVEATERSSARERETLSKNLAKVSILFIGRHYINIGNFSTLDEEERYYCEHCNKNFRGEEFYKAHLGSKTHKRNLKHFATGKCISRSVQF